VGEANRAAVERGLFRGLESSSDGWVDRYVNRQLSPWFSRRFLRVPLTPNQVTLIALAIGLLAAFCFARGGWLSGVVGALLLQWSAVIDCCDGEVARLTFLESTSGYYLDIVCDNIVHVAVFAGIAWSSFQVLGQTYVLLLGGLAALGTTMAFVVVLVTRHGRARQPLAAIDRLIDALANRDFSLILVICALTGTLQWFLWTLTIGVNLFWPIVLALARQAQRTGHG
jgi:phosphatidylglycerophosphate synthase